MPLGRRLLAAALAVCGANAVTAIADEVSLDHGGVIWGEVVRDADTPHSHLAVQSTWGSITLRRSRVSRVDPESPAEAEYRRRAPTVSDTAEAQYALAMWCRDNGLGDELRVHLQRVIDFEPDHAEARQLLGYQRRDGEWVTRDELLASRGLIRHDGEFRTQQEIALVEQAERAEQTRRDWTDRLAEWRRDLDDRDARAARDAEKRFASLTDPLASSAVGDLLVEESHPGARLLLIDAAGRLDTATTVRALVAVALESPDPEARAAALEQLQESTRKGLTAPFLAGLRSGDNRRINLAAEGLTVLGDERTLKPLVDALTTVHRRRVGNDGPGDTYSFNNATGQFAFGGGGSRVVSNEVRNPSVHRALVEMTGVNFLYDKERWRAWLAGREKSVPIDLRRDS